SNSVTPGTYPLTVVASSSGLSSTSTVALVINSIPVTPGWSTWSGASGSGANWSDAANWGGAAPPPNSSLIFAGITRLDTTNDTPSLTTYSNIVFSPGAAEFTLNGNPITLLGNITNNSAAVQTINLGINFSSSLTFNGASNALEIAGGLTNTFAAPGSTTLSLLGTGTIVNLLRSTASPGGTNLVLLNQSSANWSLADNNSSAAMTVPWAFAVNNGTFNFGDGTNSPNLTLTPPNNSPQDNQVGAVTGGTGV